MKIEIEISSTKLKGFKRRILHFSRLWSSPTIVAIIALAWSYFTLQTYYKFILENHDANLIKVAELVTNSALMFTATGAGILIPILFQINLNRENDRKKLLFSLGALWNELRTNKHALESFKDNFEFAAIVDPSNKLFTLEEKIEQLVMKFSSISCISESFSLAAYDSLLNTGAITHLSCDEIYNLICNTYELLVDFRNEYFLVKSSFILRKASCDFLMKTRFTTISGSPGESVVYKELDIKLISLFSSLLRTQLKFDECIKAIGLEINKLGAQNELIPLAVEKHTAFP